MATLLQQVGGLIRFHRERAGLTKMQLAERSGRSLELVGRVERGSTAASLDTLEAFAGALNVPVRDFFGSGDFTAGDGDDQLARIVAKLINLRSDEREWVEDLLSVALARPR